MAKHEVYFPIEDPNKRAQLRVFRMSEDRHYVVVDGCDDGLRKLGGFSLRIPRDQIGVFCYHLQAYLAGELGRLALHTEYMKNHKE